MTKKNNSLNPKSSPRSGTTQPSVLSPKHSPSSSVLSPQSSTEPSVLSPQSSNLLITGGCGFIGTNLLDFMLKKGFTNFRILDNLSLGQIEDLESVLSEHGHFEKTEEDRKITYSLPQPLFAQSSALSPQSCYVSSVLSPPQSPQQSPQSCSVELIIGDIRDPKDCLRCTEKVAAVVHLAAQSGVPTSVENPLLDCEINVIGTLNVLEACRKNGVDKFIFASSGAPLGEVEPPIHEEKVPHPVSPYGASKLAGEAYCNAYYKTFRIKTVVLRFGNVYGPRSNHKTSVVAKFFKRALEGQPLEIYGDGTQTRDFIYVEDLCNAIYLSLHALHLSPQSSVLSPKVSPQSSSLSPDFSDPDFHHVEYKCHLTGASLNNDSSLLTPHSSLKKIAGEVFQIATFKETTVKEVAEKIKSLVDSEQIAGRKVEVRYVGDRLGDVKRNYSDISKAKDLLGFRPAFDLQQGLLNTSKAFTSAPCGACEVSKTILN